MKKLNRRAKDRIRIPPNSSYFQGQAAKKCISSFRISQRAHPRRALTMPPAGASSARAPERLPRELRNEWRDLDLELKWRLRAQPEQTLKYLRFLKDKRRANRLSELVPSSPAS